MCKTATRPTQQCDHPQSAGHDANKPVRKTRIDPEEVQTDYGQFRRKGGCYHHKTGELVKVRADIADTWFSIPATTETETGYVTSRDDKELEFRPHTTQDETPEEFRKRIRKAYK